MIRNLLVTRIKEAIAFSILSTCSSTLMAVVASKEDLGKILKSSTLATFVLRLCIPPCPTASMVFTLLGLISVAIMGKFRYSSSSLHMNVPLPLPTSSRLSGSMPRIMPSVAVVWGRVGSLWKDAIGSFYLNEQKLSCLKCLSTGLSHIYIDMSMTTETVISS